MDEARLETELHEVGRRLAADMPAQTRNPLKAIDDKAMDFASSDQELKAALFRFVDVTPACTSLDDLARHLSAYLDVVDERPPPLAAAMRMSQSKAGRTALGAAAARIVSSVLYLTPRRSQVALSCASTSVTSASRWVSVGARKS